MIGFPHAVQETANNKRKNNKMTTKKQYDGKRYSLVLDSVWNQSGNIQLIGNELKSEPVEALQDIHQLIAFRDALGFGKLRRSDIGNCFDYELDETEVDYIRFHNYDIFESSIQYGLNRDQLSRLVAPLLESVGYKVGPFKDVPVGVMSKNQNDLEDLMTALGWRGLTLSEFVSKIENRKEYIEIDKREALA